VPAAPAAQANAAPEALSVLPAASTSSDVEAAGEETESHTALEEIRAAALAALEPKTAAAQAATEAVPLARLFPRN